MGCKKETKKVSGTGKFSYEIKNMKAKRDLGPQKGYDISRMSNVRKPKSSNSSKSNKKK